MIGDYYRHSYSTLDVCNLSLVLHAHAAASVARHPSEPRRAITAPRVDLADAEGPAGYSTSAAAVLVLDSCEARKRARRDAFLTNYRKIG